jgi:DNA-binding Xre family transcriptional regulator
MKYNIDKYIRKMGDNYWRNVLTLSDATGVHPTTIIRWARLRTTDKRGIWLDNMYKLADFFNCKIDDLVNKPQK